MSVPELTTSIENKEYVDHIVGLGYQEDVPGEVPHVGGFTYFVVPRGTLSESHATPNYELVSDKMHEITIAIGDNVPRHVRGFLVGHTVMHRALPEEPVDFMCAVFDKKIQAVMSELEPSIIEPYYLEALTMYRQGMAWYRQAMTLPTYRSHMTGIESRRYQVAAKNAEHRHSAATEASEIRKRLADLGLVLPNEKTSLQVVDKRDGERMIASLQTEGRKTGHVCRNCSHKIPFKTPRITTSTVRPKKQGYDHHHYHPGCFTHVELADFGDPHQAAVPPRP